MAFLEPSSPARPFTRGIGTPRALQRFLDGAPGYEDLGAEPTRRVWREERRERERLLGVHVPPVLVPDWPEVLVRPGFSKDRVNPTHFRSYTRLADGSLLCHSADTHDRARWELERLAERR